MAYRWAHTDAVLMAQLELESEGHPGVLAPGHAAVRFTNPATGGDALPTMTLDGQPHDLTRGDVVAVPSWCELRLRAATDLDLFTFSDAPVIEKLSLLRTEP